MQNMTEKEILMKLRETLNCGDSTIARKAGLSVQTLFKIRNDIGSLRRNVVREKLLTLLDKTLNNSETLTRIEKMEIELAKLKSDLGVK